jgi:hypothetical protein
MPVLTSVVARYEPQTAAPEAKAPLEAASAVRFRLPRAGRDLFRGGRAPSRL